MKAFVQHLIAFLEAKWVALVHAWPGYIAVAILVIGGTEAKLAAVIGALIHAATTYLHFSSQTPTATPIDITHMAYTTSSPPNGEPPAGTSISSAAVMGHVLVSPATPEAPKTV